MSRLVIFMFFGSIITACSGSNFKGQSQPNVAPSEPRNADQEDETSSESPSGFTSASDNSSTIHTENSLGGSISDDDQETVSDCFKQWTNPKPPFASVDTSKPQVIQIQEAANNSVVYSDLQSTLKDTLLLLNLNITLGNQGILELKNPKGWYCLNVKAKIINNFSIQLACKTQLALVSRDAQNDHNFNVTREPCL